MGKTPVEPYQIGNAHYLRLPVEYRRAAGLQVHDNVLLKPISKDELFIYKA